MLDFKVNATHLKSPKVVFGLAAEKLDFNTLFPPLPAKPAPAKVANDSAAPAETAPATAKSPPAAQSASATPSLSFLDSVRSEEHTSELQSLMRISYAVFCL